MPLPSSRFEVAPELNAQYEHSIRSVPDVRIPLPRAIQDLIDYPLFQRLRAVKQLAFVDRVYPDATHSRFAHSLGVYGNAVLYCQSLIANRWSSEFRDRLDERDLRTLLVAALLHDVGQYPFAHVIEDSMRRASGRIGVDEVNHEALTRKILLDADFRVAQTTECGYSGDDLELLINRAGTTPEEVVAVLEGKGARDLKEEDSRLLKSIIDGPIDVDKLDYLRRDSHHAGVQFGLKIDVPRLLQCLAVVENHHGQAGANARLEIGIVEKGVSAAEEVLLARSHMFTQVYWHRTVRAHEAVLAAAINKLRRSTSGFDEWFSRNMIGPRVGDSDLLSACARIADGHENGDVQLLTTDDSRRLRTEASSMVRSLLWISGRSPYKQLVSLGKKDDEVAYSTLQAIREVAVTKHPEVFDQLASAFATRLSQQVGVSVDPADIIIDIPAVRSSANSVGVLGTEGSRFDQVTPLYEYSKVWQQFGDGFHDSTCQIRVFVPQSLRGSLAAADQNIKMVALLELQEVAVTVGRQLADQIELDI